MKTNFNSKLFEKQIDLKSCNRFMGGNSQQTSSGYSHHNNNDPAYDHTVQTYNDNGQLLSECITFL